MICCPHSHAPDPVLQSFPTRRSSDLALGIITARGLRALENHTRVTVGGVVTHRQRPATARGVTFLNLEDERSEEHTSELQSLTNIVCRLLLEKKKHAQQVTKTVQLSG